MNEETRKLALERKRALSMERRQKALLLLEEGMSRREIAEILGMSVGSVNVYCKGFISSAGIRKPISKPINTNKHIDIKKIEEKYHDLLKELIMAFIQESIETILSEIPIQDIIETETTKALKNANVGFLPNNNKAVKVESKKKNPVSAPVVEETPIQNIKTNTLEILTAEQLMKILPINEPTLAVLVKQNEIPHFYMGKRKLRFRIEEIKDWLSKIAKQGSI
jgi:predicted transcriptional regulator/predicted DNA-binding transcriptional regulator AlpA